MFYEGNLIRVFTGKFNKEYYYDKNELVKMYVEQILNQEYQAEEVLDYEEIDKKLKSGEMSLLEVINLHFRRKPNSDIELSIRSALHSCNIYGNVTEKFLDSLQHFFGKSKVLEVCSGSGYLANGLINKGVDVIPTDIHPFGIHSGKVEYLSAIDALKKYGADVDYVMLSWSPLYDDLDYQVLKEIRKSYPHIKMLVLGERYGCTNSKKFWDSAISCKDERFDEVSQSYESWYGIKDSPYLIK